MKETTKHGIAYQGMYIDLAIGTKSFFERRRQRYLFERALKRLCNIAADALTVWYRVWTVLLELTYYIRRLHNLCEDGRSPSETQERCLTSRYLPLPVRNRFHLPYRRAVSTLCR